MHTCSLLEHLWCSVLIKSCFESTYMQCEVDTFSLLEYLNRVDPWCFIFIFRKPQNLYSVLHPNSILLYAQGPNELLFILVYVFNLSPIRLLGVRYVFYSYVFMFAIGVGPVPLALLPEIFPNRIRAKAMAVSMSIFWVRTTKSHKYVLIQFYRDFSLIEREI